MTDSVSKLADYGIVKVCMTKDRKHIQEVMVIKEPLSNEQGDSDPCKREDIVKLLDSKRHVKAPSVITLLPVKAFHDRLKGVVWLKGVPVKNHDLKSGRFIKTSPNDREEDNLENIEEYDDCHLTNIQRMARELLKIRHNNG